MSAGHKYLGALVELAQRSATGEFIAVADELEVHVFFQLGRVAWGTTSIYRFAFSRHLFQHCNVDKDMFRELVETCRAEHKPLGETLVAWGLVTQEEVRDALAVQLMETLECLAELDNAQTLFLPRDSFADYDEQLTFAVEEILLKVGFALEEPQETVKEQQPDLGSQRDLRAIFDRFRADVPDALWMELLAADSVSSTPDMHTSTVGSVLAPLFLEGGADFVAIRTLAGTVLGGTIPGDDESLWTGLGRNATIGNALSALGPLLAARLTASQGPCRHLQSPWSITGEGEEVLGRVRAAIEHTDEVLAAFCLSDEGGLLWACARESLPLGDLARSAQQWSTALELPRIDAAFESTQPPESSNVRYSTRSLVVADSEMWTYGHGCRSGSRGGLWLCVDRSTSQGLGWAILTSLARFVCTTEATQ